MSRAHILAEKHPHIRRTNEQREGRFVALSIVTCSVCHHPREWPQFPPDMTARYLTERGYTRPTDARRIACPQCAVRARALIIRQAAPPAVPAPEPKEKPMPKPEPAAKPAVKSLTVEAPRDATPQDNIRILDALEAAYDRKAGCYHGDGSDARTADTLKVPRAWVASIRLQLFGQQDTNQKRRETPARLDDMEARLKRQEEKLYAALAEVETDLKLVREMRVDLVVA